VIRCTLGVNHHPVVIVEATEAAEVVAAVRPAARNGRAVAAMNPGHGPTVPADGAVMITSGRMGCGRRRPARADRADGSGCPLAGCDRATTRMGWRR
jgi:hypothetical protein